MDQHSISLNDATDILRRRWPFAASVALLVFLGGVVTTFTLENVYRSVGKVSVTEPQYPVGSYPKPTLPLDERISDLTDEVVTRNNLIEAIETFNLFPDDRVDDNPESVTGLVRPNLEIELKRKETEANDRNLGKVVGFTVNFSYGDPRTARDVASFFLRKFVYAKDARREEIYGVAIANLEKEAADFEAQLDAEEEALARFEERYPDAMPDRIRWNMQQVETKSNRLIQTEADIRSQDARVAELMRRLEETPAIIVDDELEIRIAALRQQCAEFIGIYAPGHPEVRRVEQQLEALTGVGGSCLERPMLERELRLVLEKLETMPYGREHPERRAAERRVEALQQELEQLPADSPRPIKEPTNPDYVSLQLQLTAARSELRARQDVQSTLKTEIAALEASLNIAPRVKLELQGILRKIDLLAEEVMSANKRLIAARKGIESDPWETWRETYPGVNLAAVSPNRPLFVILGAFIGLTLGMGAGLTREAFDGTVRGTRGVRSVMEMPPLTAIPVIKTASDRRRDRLRLATVTAMVLVAVGAVGTYVHFQINGLI